MLIIFDLDDTLIDTSGCITPFKIHGVLEIVLQSSVGPSQLEEFNALNERSMRTEDAIISFAKRYQASDARIQQALFELTAPLPEDFQIRCTPNAKQILNYYHSLYPLALVTGGRPAFQLEKLKKAGIEASLFSKIAIPEDSIKKPFYQGLFREYSKNPEEVWVCGDRITVDLLPAWELGFKTIHMRWGRGQRMQCASWVDHSISDLSELRNIIP